MVMAGYTSMFDSISPFHACFHGFLEISMDFEGDFNPYAPWCWNMFTNICQQNVPNVVIPVIPCYSINWSIRRAWISWAFPLGLPVTHMDCRRSKTEGGREDQLGGVLAEDESLCIGRFARDLRRRRADLQWWFSTFNGGWMGLNDT